MADTKDLIVRLTLENGQFKAQVAEGARNVGELEKKATGAQSAFSNLGGALRGVGAFLAGGAIARGVMGMIKLAAGAEQTAVAFRVFLGNAEKATELLAEIEDFAARTPFEQMDIQDAAKRLLAFGVAADDVMGTLKKIGDVSAGTGKNMAELAVIYGQVKQQGRLMGQDMLQFINAGIPITKVLAENMGVAETEIRALVEAGKVGFADVDKAFSTMTGSGGIFFNMMEEQSKTASGQFSTLKDNFNIFAKDVGTAINSVLTPMMAWFNKMPPVVQKTTFAIGALAIAVGAAAFAFGPMGAIIMASVAAAGLLSIAVAKVADDMNETADEAIARVRELNDEQRKQAAKSGEISALMAIQGKSLKDLAAAEKEYLDALRQASAEEDLQKKRLEDAKAAGKDTLNIEKQLAFAINTRTAIQKSLGIIQSEIAKKEADEAAKARAALADRLKLNTEYAKSRESILNSHQSETEKLEAEISLIDRILAAGISTVQQQNDLLAARDENLVKIEEIRKKEEEAGMGRKAEMNDYFNLASTVFNGISDIVATNNQRRLDAINVEMEKELAHAEQQGATEAELDAIRTKYSDKARKEKTRAAKAAKAANLLEAITNTAAGVSRAFKDYAMPWALIPAAAAGIAGGVQIGKIASEPIPAFASGGVVGGVMQSPMTPPGEDGLVAVQRGESILTRQATAILGPDAISMLNGMGGSSNVNVTVQDARGAVKILNDWARTQGGNRGSGL
jgi:tape measure domain-containing protein